MSNVVWLVGCGKEKLDVEAPARSLYTGPLFTKALAYALTQGGPVYVLSALHGLVDLDHVLAPYDVTMSELRPAERIRWANRVAAGLEAHGHPLRRTHFVILAGKKYVKPLRRHLVSWEAPMDGMGLGYRMQWLGRELRRIERRAQLRVPV